jgi:hypothetical protein
VTGILERLLRAFREPCSKCGERELRARNWIRATCVDERGRRYPDSWTYYSCDACGDRSKRYVDGRVEAPTDEEWREHVSELEKNARP